MKNTIKTGIFALLFAASTGVQAENIAVIVNPDYEGASINRQLIEQIYMGQSVRMTPYDLPNSSPVKEQFYRRLTGRSLAQVEAIWSRLMFSGRARPPDQLINAKAVKRTIASNVDAIGYIVESSVDDTVKVVLTLTD